VSIKKQPDLVKLAELKCAADVESGASKGEPLVVATQAERLATIRPGWRVFVNNGTHRQKACTLQLLRLRHPGHHLIFEFQERDASDAK
jgi:hypothetical protein